MHRNTIVMSVCALAASTAAGSPVGVDWTTGGEPATGTLGGVGLTVSNFIDSDAFIDSADLSASNPAYDAFPLGANQEALNYSVGSAWTATFDSPIDGLLLYVRGWRMYSYDFDQSFTIVDGLAGATVGAGDVLSTGPGFSDGILLFSGSISNLSVVPSGGTGSAQLMTFGAVPAPGAMVVLGLAGVCATRRRGG